jgi:hypothetical protein
MKKNPKKNLTTVNKSIILKLSQRGFLNDSILTSINNLSLEDLIAIKLELSASNINNRLYGFDMWRNTKYIIQDALLKFAVSTTKSKKDAARFLGLTYSEFKKVSDRYKIEEYFSDDI